MANPACGSSAVQDTRVPVSDTRPAPRGKPHTMSTPTLGPHNMDGGKQTIFFWVFVFAPGFFVFSGFLGLFLLFFQFEKALWS